MNTPLPAVDESVHIPQAVKDAAAKANAYFAAPAPPPAPAAPAAPAPAPAPDDGDRPISIVAAAEPVAPSPHVVAPMVVTPAPAVVPAPALAAPAAAPVPAVSAAEWEHRYNSMKGRFDQSQQTLGVIQEQLAETINQNLALQTEVERIARPAAPPAPPAPVITDQDRQTYGDELLGVVQRVAQAAVQPGIQRVVQDNEQTRRELQQGAQRAMYAELSGAVPNWRAINVDPGFLQWLSLPDVYAGQVRRGLLMAAFRAAQAPRVIAFFKGYLAEAQATGQISAVPQPAAAPTAPAEPAVPLMSFAAPGAAIPATGTPPAPTDKPIYTHAQIRLFYDQVRRGQWAGRDADRLALERDMIAAAPEGRVRG